MNRAKQARKNEREQAPEWGAKSVPGSGCFPGRKGDWQVGTEVLFERKEGYPHIDLPLGRSRIDGRNTVTVKGTDLHRALTTAVPHDWKAVEAAWKNAQVIRWWHKIVAEAFSCGYPIPCLLLVEQNVALLWEDDWKELCNGGPGE